MLATSVWLTRRDIANIFVHVFSILTIEVNTLTSVILCQRSFFNSDRQCLVVYVDFGNSEWVNIKGIRLLDAEFTQLEAQGMSVTLSHVCRSLASIFVCWSWFTDYPRLFLRKIWTAVWSTGRATPASNVHENCVAYWWNRMRNRFYSSRLRFYLMILGGHCRLLQWNLMDR